MASWFRHGTRLGTSSQPQHCWSPPEGRETQASEISLRLRSRCEPDSARPPVWQWQLRQVDNEACEIGGSPVQEVRLVTAVLDGIGPAMAVHRRHQLRPDLHRPNCCGLACQSISDQPITDGNGVHKPSLS